MNDAMCSGVPHKNYKVGNWRVFTQAVKSMLAFTVPLLLTSLLRIRPHEVVSPRFDLHPVATSKLQPRSHCCPPVDRHWPGRHLWTDSVLYAGSLRASFA